MRAEAKILKLPGPLSGPWNLADRDSALMYSVRFYPPPPPPMKILAPPLEITGISQE